MVKMRHLRYFVVLAEELHFSRAAKRLHISQPGLSQQIQTLELAMGVPLLDRSRRRVRLTPAGEALYEEGRRALSEVDRAIDFARKIGHGVVGRLQVGAISSAVYGVMPPLLREYRARFPNVDLVFREMTTPVQVNAMRNGEVDIGFMRLPYDTGNWATRTVREEELAVLFPQGHPLAESPQVTLTALRDEPLIVWPAFPRPSWADYVIGLCRQAGFEPRVVQEANESLTLISFVASGIGVAIVPEGLKLLLRSDVVYRPVAPPAPKLRLAAVYPRVNTPGPVKALLELLDQQWPLAEPPSSAESDE